MQTAIAAGLLPTIGYTKMNQPERKRNGRSRKGSSPFAFSITTTIRKTDGGFSGGPSDEGTQ